MTISELITELERIKAAEGPDLPVYLWDESTSTPFDMDWGDTLLEEDPFDDFNKPMLRGLIL